MFPIGERKIAMTRIKEIMEIVRKCKNMNDPEIVAIIIEFHNLAKEHDLYEWADKEDRI